MDEFKEFLIKFKWQLIIALVVILLLVGSIFTYRFYFLNNKEEKIVRVDEVVKKESVKTVVKEEINLIKVDIKGEVVKPGVYEVNENFVVNDVIALAGGLTKNANTSVINLSKKVFAEMVIIIYSKNQVYNFVKVKEEEKIKNEACSCPDIDITNDACIENSKLEENNSEVSSTEGSEVTNSKISINTATVEQLMTLSGIGESRANDIINYRKTNGLFKTIEGIMDVSGIGESIFAKIKDFITI